MPRQTSTARSISDSEVAHFSATAGDWWNPDGAFRPLHRLNPVRLGYVRDQICAHFVRDGQSRTSLKGLKILDVGCGGGLMTEPMARLGATVTGVDASEQTIVVASAHARQSKLNITYRASSVEELAQTRVKFNVITALEIVEHVADVGSFVGALKAMLAPGGLLIMSTLNRTPKSFMLGIVAAEYVLGWVPRGTHQWSKFLRPSELVDQLRGLNLEVADLTGLIFNPLRNEFALSKSDLDVNYLLTTRHVVQ